MLMAAEPATVLGHGAPPRPLGYARRAVLVLGGPELSHHLRTLRTEGYELEVGTPAHGDTRPRALAVLDVSRSVPAPALLAARIAAIPAAQVVVVTAPGADARISAFEAGADMVISAPVHQGELLARVRAALRRSEPDAIRSVGGLRLDRERRTADGPRGRIALRTREFDLLWAMAGRPGVVFTRSGLAESVWAGSIFAGSRTIDVHVGQLRAKLAEAGLAGVRLVTVWSVGYRLELDAAA